MKMVLLVQEANIYKKMCVVSVMFVDASSIFSLGLYTLKFLGVLLTPALYRAVRIDSIDKDTKVCTQILKHTRTPILYI